LLVYSRNKLTTIEDLENGSLLVKVTSNDTWLSLSMEMTVKVPDMEITDVKGEFNRCFYEKCRETLPVLQEAVGIRIGSGLIKNINALVGSRTGCRRMADMILDGCDQVINRFTFSTLRQMQDVKEEDRAAAQKEFLKMNPQLIGSCIAYAKDSPLVRGVGINRDGSIII
jgi:hypothetical protein